MINPKKHLILTVLFLLLILSIKLSAKEMQTEPITITDAKQLKGVWEAFYLCQEIPRQERVRTYVPPFPQKEEFESKQDYQRRIDRIKNVYERRVEEKIKMEINNERNLKNMVFKINFLYTPKYDPSNVTPTSKMEKPYRHKEETKVQRTTFTSKYFKTPIACMQEIHDSMLYLELGFIHHLLTIPVPPTIASTIGQWKIEENNLRIQENSAYFNFSLGRYDMENEKFSIVFPFSQFPKNEKDWVYYIRKLNFGDYYMEMFEKSDMEKTEEWSIKFNTLPSCIPFSLNKAKLLREKEQNLTLELEFQPLYAEQQSNLNTTYNTLHVDLISATLKDGNNVLYTISEAIH